MRSQKRKRSYESYKKIYVVDAKKYDLATVTLFLKSTVSTNIFFQVFFNWVLAQKYCKNRLLYVWLQIEPPVRYRHVARRDLNLYFTRYLQCVPVGTYPTQ